MDIIKTEEPITAVPLFLCKVKFVDECEAVIDLNVSDVLQPYESLGGMFDEMIENMSDILVNDILLLCQGLSLIFDEETLEDTGFVLEHVLLEDNTCYVEFDEEYYNLLTQDITAEQMIKLNFLIELFLQTSNSTHDLISDLLGTLTECMDKNEG